MQKELQEEKDLEKAEHLQEVITDQNLSYAELWSVFIFASDNLQHLSASQ